jgi:crossover junction endodeoxyribonuclease RusA
VNGPSDGAAGPSPQTRRAPSPAGGTPDPSVPPAGSAPRTYTVELPAGLKLLSLNDRLHWAERDRRTEALKKAAWAMAWQAKIPPLGRVSIVAEYQPPDGRHRDADNIAPAAKAAIDGLVIAQVVPDDESPRYVTEVICRIGEPYPRGRLVLRLTEVTEAA